MLAHNALKVAGTAAAVLGVQAIAQAAAYPGPHPDRAAPSQKLAATLASVIVGGDRAAANRAPAPQQAEAEGAPEDVAAKVNACLGCQEQMNECLGCLP